MLFFVKFMSLATVKNTHFFKYSAGCCIGTKNVFLGSDQLDVQFFYFIIRLLQSYTCFEQRRAHHQEVNLTLPNAVLIKFGLLMMSTTLLETCRGL